MLRPCVAKSVQYADALTVMMSPLYFEMLHVIEV